MKEEQKKPIFKQLRRQKLKEVEIIGGIAPRGYMTLIASAPGVGKSWFTLYLACQLSVGGSILKDMEQDAPPRRVLIFSGETGADLMVRRLNKTTWPINENNVSIVSALELGLSNYEYRLNEPQGKKLIANHISAVRPDLVIFDTLISFHSVDESRQGEMQDVYMTVCKLANFFDCAIICNHHTRKRPADNPSRLQTQDDVIGTSTGIRLAANVFIMQEEIDEQHISLKKMIGVRCVKSWNEKPRAFSWGLAVNLKNQIDIMIFMNTYRYPKDLSMKIYNIVMSNKQDTIYRANVLAQTCKCSEQSIRNFFDMFIAGSSYSCMNTSLFQRVIMNGDTRTVYYKQVGTNEEIERAFSLFHTRPWPTNDNVDYQKKAE